LLPADSREPNAMRYHLKIVDRPEQWRAMHDIRRAVLFAPDRHAIAYDEDHPDDRVDGNTPFLFCENDEPVGVARLDAHGDVGIVRLVAIVADRQRTGLGRAMDMALVAEARRRGINTLRVNAAADAVGFYEKTGWHKAGWNPAELTGMARDAVQMQKAIDG
jgi:GNAT superfamily N-acetyltransferase